MMKSALFLYIIFFMSFHNYNLAQYEHSIYKKKPYNPNIESSKKQKTIEYIFIIV